LVIEKNSKMTSQIINFGLTKNIGPKVSHCHEYSLFYIMTQFSDLV
jgi:hypothetical protein